MIVLAELIRSCSHEKVADAALASIGLGFQRKIASVARADGLSSGAYAASVVRAFARAASERDWSELAARIEGADMPILTGLRHIVETSADMRIGASCGGIPGSASSVGEIRCIS